MEENTAAVNPVTINSQQSPPASDAGQAPLDTNPEKPKPKFSIAAIIGTILFLLVAGGAAASLTVLKPQLERLVSTPTPTPTIIQTPTPTITTEPENETIIQSLNDGHVKQLKSNRYNISFNFPSSWQYVKNAEGEFGLSYVFPNGEGDLVTNGEGCGFYLGNHGGGDGPTKIFKTSTISLDNKKMTVRSWLLTVDGPAVFNYYFDEEENKAFVIWSWVSKENSETCQKSIDQILSTFKFTENSAENQLLKEKQDSETRNTLVEFSNANIRYYATHAGFPWSTTGPCQSSTTAAPRGTSLSQMIPCISLLIEEGELKSSFLSANGQSISKIFINSSGSELNMCYKPSSIKEQQEPKTIYDSYGKVDRSCVSTGNMCFWCTGI